MSARALHVSPDLSLPLDTVTGTLAVLGIRGSGKSTTATVIVEELLAQRQQVVVIDPTDVWWGLKSSADGKAPGYPVVILGGRRADLPLAAGDGAAIADFLVESGASVVCSLRHFESQRDMRRFVTDFARRLYFRKGQEGRGTPLMCVFDEASLFVPQRVMGEDAPMVGAIQKLVRQGRASGFGVMLIDQRASTVNKDVLTQVEALVCHRTVAPQDRKALQGWIDQHDSAGLGERFLTSLPKLPQGTAWFWSPEWLDVFAQVAVRNARTFDSRRTPKAGEQLAAPTRVAPVDLDALKAKLAATIEQARADDPTALRARIAELERELRGRGAADPAAIAAAEQRGREAAMADLRSLVVPQTRALARAGDALLEAATTTGDAIRAVFDTLGEARAAAVTPRFSPPAPAENTAVTPASRRPAPEPRPTPATGAVSPSEQRILDALALMEAIGAPSLKTNLGFFAGYAEGGRFNNLLGGLRTAGLIEYPTPGAIALTDRGRALADADAHPVRTLADLHALWLGKLPPSEGKLLHALLDVYPRALTKEQLGARTGYSEGGRYNNLLGRLRSLGAITKTGPIAATDVLFPKGLR